MNSDQPTVNLSWNLIWGILFLGLGLHWWQLGRDRWADWRAANKPVPRSFDPAPSPMAQVGLGCVGFVLSFVYRFTAGICFILAFDQFFTNGEFILLRSGEILRSLYEVLFV